MYALLCFDNTIFSGFLIFNIFFLIIKKNYCLAGSKNSKVMAIGKILVKILTRRAMLLPVMRKFKQKKTQRCRSKI